MFKKISVLAALAAFAFVSGAYAESQEEAEAMCKRYAQEDKIASEDMEQFMAECIKDLTEEASKEDK
jgi:hypothetical protein